jgi:hypothetical protein
MRRVLLLALAAVTIAAPSASALAPGDVAVSRNHQFRVTILRVPSPIPANRLHSWRVAIRTRSGKPVLGARIAIDGDMPAHGHGLPTRPQARPLGRGRYAIEGVRFQMPGAWYLELRITHRGLTDRARFRFVLR